MGNYNEKLQTIDKNKAIEENNGSWNQESYFFEKYDYDKTYLENNINDIFLKYIDCKCEGIRSKLDSNSVNNISEYLLSIPYLTGLKLPLKNQDLSNIKTFNSALLKLKSLMVLDLNMQFSKLTDSELTDFIDSLQNLENLVDMQLNMSFTNFSHKSIETLSQILPKMSNLNELALELEATPLRNEDFFVLLIAIGNLRNLCYLALRIYDSDIGDPGLEILSTSLKGLEYLSGLELRINTNITNFGFDFLIDMLILKKNTLVALKLFFNLNQIKNIYKIPELINSQKYLMELQWTFVNIVINIKETVTAINDSLYLMDCILIPSVSFNVEMMRKKAKIIPVMHTITSKLKKSKYRREIVEEIMELCLNKQN